MKKHKTPENIITLIQISDLHIRNGKPYRQLNSIEVTNKLINQISKGGIYDYCILTGDLVDPCSSDNYVELLPIITKLQSFCKKVCVTAGNHDNLQLMEQILPQDILFPPFVADIGGRYIASINASYGSENPKFPENEMSILKNKFIEPKPVTLFSHHHVKQIGVPKLDAEMVSNFSDLQNLLGARIDSYFFGHIHQPYRSKLSDPKNSTNSVALYGCPSAVKNFPIMQNLFNGYTNGYNLVRFTDNGKLKVRTINAKF